MKDFNELEYLKTIYGPKKVMTLQELVDQMMVSEITVRRKLKKAGAITSFNKNGKYYTLPHIPDFDLNGLWNYKEIRFSIYGNLKQTIIQLVNKSTNGMHAETIGELINYLPHSLMNQLCKNALIQREKIEGKYMYFAIEPAVYRAQYNNYKSLVSRQREDDIPCITAVSLLIEKIKKPKAGSSELAKTLCRENIKISEQQVAQFFDKHGIEKKTPDSK